MAKEATLKDRRKHPRYSVYMPIMVQRPRCGGSGKNSLVHEAFCIDISHGGIRFGCAELFNLNEALVLTLCTPDGATEITCEARVTRVARVANHYEIAAAITTVLPAEETVAASAEAATQT